MPDPWLLLPLALIFTLTGIPEFCALPVADQEEGVVQMLPERRFLQKDLQRVRGDLGAALDSWITKRQHPGKREEEEEIEAEEGGDLGEEGAWSPHKRQHPGRRANQDKYSWVEAEDSNWVPTTRLPGFFLESWYLDQVKRQHPGRRSFPWMESDVTKRQHPGRRFIDPKFQRSWEEKEEGEGIPMPEKRQHPGKRALGQPCGPQGTCGQTDLLQFLGDLSRGQETLEKQSPQLEAWDREPLFQD
ncbi:LOW QUALITY PROTEIN: pro-thyrotropin-releasing hormone [Mesocricetus auratus]|uniref:Pro-thyrotropin-releasing hormone n=1 Tax=Mesocricetus auratus TaxID=10036 RepID=A0A3Q0CLB9_MESAU|nr:LOW QUALITY PROTEIN: pro-thyrotropin-releasing hormone [Mesocricetus auratus]